MTHTADNTDRQEGATVTDLSEAITAAAIALYGPGLADRYRDYVARGVEAAATLIIAAERKRITDGIAFITADLDGTDWAEALTAFEDALHVVNNPKPAPSSSVGGTTTSSEEQTR